MQLSEMDVFYDIIDHEKTASYQYMYDDSDELVKCINTLRTMLPDLHTQPGVKQAERELKIILKNITPVQAKKLWFTLWIRNAFTEQRIIDLLIPFGEPNDYLTILEEKIPLGHEYGLLLWRYEALVICLLDKLEDLERHRSIKFLFEEEAKIIRAVEIMEQGGPLDPVNIEEAVMFVKHLKLTLWHGYADLRYEELIKANRLPYDIAMSHTYKDDITFLKNEIQRLSGHIRSLLEKFTYDQLMDFWVNISRRGRWSAETNLNGFLVPSLNKTLSNPEKDSERKELESFLSFHIPGPRHTKDSTKRLVLWKWEALAIDLEARLAALQIKIGEMGTVDNPAEKVLELNPDYYGDSMEEERAIYDLKNGLPLFRDSPEGELMREITDILNILSNCQAKKLWFAIWIRQQFPGQTLANLFMPLEEPYDFVKLLKEKMLACDKSLLILWKQEAVALQLEGRLRAMEKHQEIKFLLQDEACGILEVESMDVNPMKVALAEGVFSDFKRQLRHTDEEIVQQAHQLQTDMFLDSGLNGDEGPQKNEFQRVSDYIIGLLENFTYDHLKDLWLNLCRRERWGTREDMKGFFVPSFHKTLSVAETVYERQELQSFLKTNIPANDSMTQKYWINLCARDRSTAETIKRIFYPHMTREDLGNNHSFLFKDVYFMTFLKSKYIVDEHRRLHLWKWEVTIIDSESRLDRLKIKRANEMSVAAPGV